jgi:hypothetical protein
LPLFLAIVAFFLSDARGWSSIRSHVFHHFGREDVTYDHLQLDKEIHTSGAWAGWTVERVQDDQGRLQKLLVSHGSQTRTFSFGYDGSSRLTSSTSPELAASFPPTATGKAGTLTGDFFGVWNVPQSWNGGGGGLVTGVVEGTLAEAGHGGRNAVADVNLNLLLPPVRETPRYTAAGFFIF